MNYITEINNFYTWLIENPIPANAQALWHRLMSYCNTFCWKDDFSLANKRLIDDLSLSEKTGRQELDRLRNILIQKNRISYKKGKGNQAGFYTVIPFASENTPQFVTQYGHNTDTNHDTTRIQSEVQSVPLDKLNKTKLNNRDSATTFKKPTVEEVAKYIAEKKYNVDAERFVNFYESKGWIVGKSKMKNWKASVASWNITEKSTQNIQTKQLTPNSREPVKNIPPEDDYLLTRRRKTPTFGEKQANLLVGQ